MAWPKGIARKGYRVGSMSKVLARRDPPVLEAVPIRKAEDHAIVLRAEKRATF